MRLDKRHGSVLLTAVLLLAMLPTSAQADTLSMCSDIINPNNIIFTGQSGSAQSILTLSLLIMVTMMLISGFLYAIGYAFRIDKVLRFAKTEIGEVLVTALIVFIFIGTFSVASLTIGTKNLFALGNGALNDNVFISDCSFLSQKSFDLIAPMFAVSYQDLAINFLGTLKINFKPDYFGVSFDPLAGMTLIRPMLTTFMYLISIFIVIPIGATMFLAFIYALFPLFLYLGIVLRTFPLTRAAGGTFLGLFIAFYVVFPMLLYVMLANYTSTAPTTAPSAGMAATITQLVSVVSSGIPTQWMNSIGETFSSIFVQGLLDSFIQDFVEPVMYVMFSIFLTLIISFDFMEALGDLLGAPSLRSADMLKRVL